MMTSTTMPAAWTQLLQQIKPFGETDYADVLTRAGEILGFSTAKVEKTGRSIARIGGLRDYDDGQVHELAHSHCTLSILWDSEPDADVVESLNSFTVVLDLALLAEDRRSQAASTPLVAPSGTKDRLTKTIDRDGFTDYLDLEFAAGPSNATVMIIGLDGMSTVNDTLGHTVGDIVIAETADRLRDTLRSCDIVSRLGGDVFGVYCPNMGIEVATKLAGRLQSAIAMPIAVQTHELRVTASVGIASRSKGEKAEQILSNGDTALQAAKADGASELAIYDGAIRMRTEDRRLLAAELVDALADNQLMTGLEPIVHLPQGSIVGVEAHVIWNHPLRGEIDRNEFMDLAELIGRVSDVERAVLEYALSEQALEDQAMRTGMNLSGSTLRDPIAIDWIADRLLSSPNKMIMEVTETAVSTGGSIVVRHLQKLRDAGASIVLDDFGLSFASIRTLHAFSFDGVKLHNDLLTDGDTARAMAIIKGVYASAEATGFDIVHSGVDNDDDLRLLMSLDSSVTGQGFYAQGRAVRARVAAANKS